MGKLKQLRSVLPGLKPRVAFLGDDKAASSRARDRVHLHRGWYHLARWHKEPDGLRYRILVRDLFICQMCGWNGGNETRRLVADHKRPHRGDPTLFWAEANLWCLCKPCHDSVKQREERAAAGEAVGGGRKSG
ncbi:MAG: HNH endonuclease signature motif containing protein [Pseudomonadota bacterium]